MQFGVFNVVPQRNLSWAERVVPGNEKALDKPLSEINAANTAVVVGGAQ